MADSNSGRVGDADQALVSDEARSVLHPSGFDPSRDDSILLIADRDKPLAYLELDDATLGRFARYHLLETNKAAGRDAVGREMPLVISMAMHAKVALAHLYTAVFGECDHVWEMTLQGLSWKGQPNGGDWRITVQRLPFAASAIEARRAETAQHGSVADESAGPKDGAHDQG